MPLGLGNIFSGRELGRSGGFKAAIGSVTWILNADPQKFLSE
jgi:hypothetical protein